MPLLLGLVDQASFDRIPAHVTEPFDTLVLRPDIEIVEAALPDFSRRPRRWEALPLPQLSQHLVGKALLQHLPGAPPIAFFADEWVFLAI